MERLPAQAARLLLMHAQGLLDDPERRARSDSLARLIRRLGFVQLDSINVIERAHHLTLATRLDGYRKPQLARLHAERRQLFEHWTHDAALLPVEWHPHWRRRFAHWEQSPRMRRWIERRMGADAPRLLRHVLDRLRREGPLMSKDFEHPRSRRSSGWWDWKPQKAALEYLWRVGRITVSERRGFHKVYDLWPRAFPDLAPGPLPGEAEHVEWACGNALERLGVATPRELAGFWGGPSLATTRAWCEAAAADGRLREVEVEAADGSPALPAFATPRALARAARLGPAPDRIRLLSPFDPVIRDRERLSRLFGFRYRFEAFVPSGQRRHGYYVLPILEADRLIGRLDPKLHRDRAHIEVRHLSWEPGVRLTRQRRQRLDDALARLANLVGARSWDLPGGGRRGPVRSQYSSAT